MPIQDYSGDYFLHLLKDLYRKANITLPQAEIDTLERLVDEERNREEKVKAWARVMDGKINGNFLDLPFEAIYSRTLEQTVQSLKIVIPPKYNNLIVVGNGRIDQAVDNSGIRVLFNDDAGANYNQQRLAASNATVLASQIFPGNWAVAGNFNGTAASADASAGFLAFVTNIRSSAWKSMYGLSALGERSSTTTGLVVTTNVWKSDKIISSLTFKDDDTNNMVAGSYFGVYGIK